jgi:hypothetical protein
MESVESKSIDVELAMRSGSMNNIIVNANDGPEDDIPKKKKKKGFMDRLGLLNQMREIDHVHEEEDENVRLVSDVIVNKLLGKDHNGFRSFMYNVDPFKSEQYIRAPKKYMDLNFAFAIFYFLGIIAYTIWAIIYFLNLPNVESNALVMASTLPPITIHLSLKCSVSWKCGDWIQDSNNSEMWNLFKPITLTSVWNDVESNSPCASENGVTKTVGANELAEDIISLQVCSSNDNLDGVYLDVPYSNALYGNGDVYLDVVVTSSGVNPLDSYKGMKNTQQVSVGQLKSMYISETIFDNEVEDSKSYEPFVGDLFYDGHTEKKMGRLGFKIQQFAREVKVVSASSFLSIAGSIGGFAGLWLTVLAMLRGSVIAISTCIHYDSHHEKAGVMCGSCTACLATCCSAGGAAA